MDDKPKSLEELAAFVAKAAGMMSRATGKPYNGFDGSLTKIVEEHLRWELGREPSPKEVQDLLDVLRVMSA
jgi:hypothetical protein